MSNTRETEAQTFRREVRERRAIVQLDNGYLHGVFVCATADEAAERTRPFIGPRLYGAAVLTRPIDIAKHLKAHRAARDAGLPPPALPVF